MLPQEVIRKKRDGGALAPEAIATFISGLTSGEVTEGQAAAFAMAVFFKSMDSDETAALTKAMRDSGRTLSWQDLDGPVLDKHSTGGIGDKVSLILAPLVAAVGGYVPMISGRGLGHTGGTLDKLDSIPGYETKADLDTFRRTVRSAGCAIIGQTADLAPADGKLYAIRDVTATVDTQPLIVASILSKKLAAGLDDLVMDVKVGSGAFMPTVEDAQQLAHDLVSVSSAAGLPCRALLTDMNQCLGSTAGNALEVREAVDFLTGQKVDARLKDVTLRLTAELIKLGGLAPNIEEAAETVERALDEGRAALCFQQMIAGLGGPSDFLERPGHYLPNAKVKRPVFLAEAGFIASIDTRAIGLSVVELGGGRARPDDKIDHSVGLSDVLALGDDADVKQPFAYVHAASDHDAERAIQHIRKAVKLSEAPMPAARPPILGSVA